MGQERIKLFNAFTACQSHSSCIHKIIELALFDGIFTSTTSSSLGDSADKEVGTFVSLLQLARLRRGHLKSIISVNNKNIPDAKAANSHGSVSSSKMDGDILGITSSFESKQTALRMLLRHNDNCCHHELNVLNELKKRI